MTKYFGSIMSVEMRRAWEVAKECDEKLVATDFSPCSLVIVREQHGMTTLVYDSAFVRQVVGGLVLGFHRASGLQCV